MVDDNEGGFGKSPQQMCRINDRPNALIAENLKKVKLV